MINELPIYMLRGLVCTLLIEVGFALLLGVRKKRDLLFVALVNLMTNPLVGSLGIAAGFFFGTTVRIICMIFLELSAFAAEALVYRKMLDYKKINPFLLSLLLNTASYFLGLLINNLL